MEPPTQALAAALADTRRWLERAVIGLNLCPFAKAVHVKGQIHWALAHEEDEPALVDALLHQAEQLAGCDAALRDTTLLVMPNAPGDFLRFHALTRQAERRLRRAGFDGVLQLASFHPRFEFADRPAGDIANATNRAPHPTWHLLREDSVARAVQAFPEAEAIYAHNIRTLQALGPQGWAALGVGAGEGRAA